VEVAPDRADHCGVLGPDAEVGENGFKNGSRILDRAPR
jgi:hypothetical protein